MAGQDKYLEAALRAAAAFGSAVAGDYSSSSMDGKGDVLRRAMESVLEGRALSYEALCASMDVCPVGRSWTDFCPVATEGPGYWSIGCAHTEAADT